jgi:phosphoribosyl 1,2-cyclic phosphate phosphodiesterase
MQLRFLGTGTSTGVPQVGCHCPTCTSLDQKDKRLRASAIVYLDNGHNILIDCGPDLREQLLRCDAPDLDAVLVTHSHYDHVGGIDDLRPYCHKKHFPLYCRADVNNDLRARVPYCFAEKLYPGVPTFDMNIIDPNSTFYVCDTLVTPLPILHYKLPIVGYRIGKLAYITDCKTMPNATLELLLGVDTLVINALRIKEHMSHMNLSQALEIIDKVKPRIAYLTHISHDMGKHSDVSIQLPKNVFLAYDGLTIDI